MARLWPEPGLGLKRPRNRSTQRWRPRLPSLIDKRTGTLATTLVSDNTRFTPTGLSGRGHPYSPPDQNMCPHFRFETVCRNGPGENVNTVGKKNMASTGHLI